MTAKRRGKKVEASSVTAAETEPELDPDPTVELFSGMESGLYQEISFTTIPSYSAGVVESFVEDSPSSKRYHNYRPVFNFDIMYLYSTFTHIIFIL